MKRFALAIGLASLAGFIRCGTNVAGSGSEQPNAFTGRVYRPIGLNYSAPYQPVADAEIILYRIQTAAGAYQWSVYKRLWSGVDGQFVIDSLSYGRYSILVQKDSVKDFAYFDYNLKSGSILVDSVNLRPGQKIEGTLRDSAGGLYAAANLGLVGTPYFDTTALDGKFAFDSVPAGIIYSFQILSEQSVLFSWSRSALDTSATAPASLLGFSSMSQVASDSSGGCDKAVFGSTQPVEDSILSGAAPPSVNTLCGWQTDTLSVQMDTSTRATTVVDGKYIIEYTVTPNP